MYDNICKYLAVTFPQDLAKWLTEKTIELTELKPTELSIEPIRADSLIFLESDDLVLHVEFQTDPQADIPFRMLDYRLRIYRRYPHKAVYQVVLYLRKSGSNLAKATIFELPGTRHEFNVIRLWEINPETLLQAPGLLPFAVLGQSENPADILGNVAEKIDEISDIGEKSNIAASTAIIAGLVLDKVVIQRLLKDEIMKESVIYQEIQARGEAKGEARGKAQGIQEGEVHLVMRLLNRCIGAMSTTLEQQIRQLTVTQLDELAIALLDFRDQTDLVNWLDSCND